MTPSDRRHPAHSDLRSVLLSLLLVLVSCATGNDPGTKSLEMRLDEIITQTMEEERIPGAALVLVQNGRVEILKGYGVADAERKIPVDPEGTLFRIGSITKFLTALALTRLMDQGVIGLDDPVSRHVSSELKIDRYDEPVRVRHLLAHSSGFDQIGRNRQTEDPSDRPSLLEFLRGELTPVRPPGVIGVYDTYGITLAGHLIEQVTAEDYATHMRRHIFLPVGMESSFVECPEPDCSRLAIGYGLEEGELRPQDYEYYVTLPASSVDSTAADMGRLILALLEDGGAILSAEMARRLREEPGLVYPAGSRAFSWGLWEDIRNGLRILHHGGVMRGYSAELMLVPEQRTGLFIVCNSDPETGPPISLRERVAQVVIDHLGQEESIDRPTTTGVDASRFEGAYASTVGCFTCAPGEGWDLGFFRVRAPEPGVLQSSRRWRAIGPFEFVEEDGNRLMEFITDERGDVRYFAIGPDSFARLDEVLIEEFEGPGWKERPATPLQATVHLANEEWASAARAYSALAEQMPDNGRVHYYGGLSFLHTGKSSAARRSFERALELGRWPGWSLYYIASTHAVEGEASKAFEVLEQAIARGFEDLNLLATEPWWNQLREDPRYAQLSSRLNG